MKKLKLSKLEKKFNPLIGCPTYIDLKNGYLIIDSKAKVLKINKSTGVGMFVGLFLSIGNIIISFISIIIGSVTVVLYHYNYIIPKFSATQSTSNLIKLNKNKKEN